MLKPPTLQSERKGGRNISKTYSEIEVEKL